MKTTSIAQHMIDHNSKDSIVLKQIISWIDTNTIFDKEGTIWRVGLASGEDVLEIQAKVMQDLECKHLKSWRLDSFREAVDTLASLCKYRFVFKSPHHHYDNKGQYLFAYKIPSPYKKHFYHVLHS